MKIEHPPTFRELVGFKPAHYTADASANFNEVHGTTVLMLRFKHGVVSIADRRATMGNLIMYDHAQKLFSLDDSTVIAISGSFARAVEVCRLLKHSLKYYRRMHLFEMSMEGKLQEISRTLAENMPMAMQGIGLFIPILAAYNKREKDFHIYLFDSAGASFQNAEFACAGSGSERIRGIFDYVSRVGKPWHQRELDDVVLDGLHMLNIAAELDSATGGFNKVLPMVHVLTKDSAIELDEAKINSLAQKVLAK